MMKYDNVPIQRVKPTLSAKLFVAGMHCLYVSMVLYGFSYSQDRQTYDTGVEHLAIIFLGSSLIVAIVMGEFRNLRIPFRIWFFLLGIYLSWMVMLGLSNGFMNFGSRRYVTYMDLGAFCFLSGIIVASYKRNWDIIQSMMLKHFCIGSVICLCSLIISTNLLSWDLVHSSNYRFWNLLYAWPYFLFHSERLDKRVYIIVLLGMGLFFVLAVLFLKRGPFLQVAVLLSAFLATRLLGGFEKRVYSIIQQGVVVTFILVLVIIGVSALNLNEQDGFSGLFERLYHVDESDRTVSIWNTISKNYRWNYEPRAVLENASLMEILFGQGIGSVIIVDYKISISGETSVLHNTLMEQVLKGGIVYLALWNVGWIMAIKYFFRSGDTALIPFGTIAFMTILLSWTNSFLSIGLAPGMVMVCGGRLMSVEQKQTRSKQRTIHSGQKPCLH